MGVVKKHGYNCDVHIGLHNNLASMQHVFRKIIRGRVMCHCMYAYVCTVDLAHLSIIDARL